MSDQAYIPKRAGANVAFLGVELKDAAILIASVFLGIICGSFFGWGNLGYLGMPLAGYFLNRIYIEWQSRNPRGVVRRYLFKLGLAGFSKTFTSQQIVFVGDNNPTCTSTFKKFTKKESLDGSDESK